MTDPQSPRHPVDITKLTGKIVAECRACGAYIESLGHDTSSRQTIATWTREHEARA